jgi:hypothetical protein
MWVVEETLAKARREISGGIEFFDRIECRVHTVLRSTSIKHPNALAIGIDVYAGHLPDFATTGRLQPIRVEAVWVGGAIRVGRRLRE